MTTKLSPGLTAALASVQAAYAAVHEYLRKDWPIGQRVRIDYGGGANWTGIIYRVGLNSSDGEDTPYILVTEDNCPGQHPRRVYLNESCTVEKIA